MPSLSSLQTNLKHHIQDSCQAPLPITLPASERRQDALRCIVVLNDVYREELRGNAKPLSVNVKSQREVMMGSFWSYAVVQRRFAGLSHGTRKHPVLAKLHAF